MSSTSQQWRAMMSKSWHPSQWFVADDPPHRQDLTPSEEQRKMYVYLRTEDALWTVGFYDPRGMWHPESSFETQDQAAARVRYLHGGN